MYNRVIAVTLGLGATVFVLLLAGVGSAFLTDDPPAVSPYASPVSEAAHLVISTVAFGDAGYIEVRNVGAGDATLDGYWLCQFPAYHPISGTLGPSQAIRFPAAETDLGALDSATGEVGLYRSDVFDDPSAIVAYVEWGEPGHRRSGTAVEAGVWTEGSAVDATGAGSIVAVDEPATSAAGWVAGS